MTQKYLRVYENETVPTFTFEQLNNPSFYETLVDSERQVFKVKFAQAKKIAAEFKQKEKDIKLFVRPDTGTLGLFFKSTNLRARKRNMVPQFSL